MHTSVAKILATVAKILGMAMLIVAGAGSSLAAKAIANAGTLTCTLAPSERSPSTGQAEAAVACNFVATTSGNSFDLSGRIVRMSTTVERNALTVVAWSVVAPTASIDPPDLTGSFTGEMPGATGSGGTAGSGILFGGKDGGIELRPLAARDGDALPKAGLTILELELASVKV
ncbi:MAG: DUF992 domain-containing protein [Alphaproteobacteria bacterium]|nr:DUF992 domain-containing protein [Alphaproteobacteria bacterium]